MQRNLNSLHYKGGDEADDLQKFEFSQQLQAPTSEIKQQVFLVSSSFNSSV